MGYDLLLIVRLGEMFTFDFYLGRFVGGHIDLQDLLPLLLKQKNKLLISVICRHV